MKPEAKRWLEIADYDTSLYLFTGARHPQAVYFLCQALEKLLKAALIEFADKPPQKTHRLENIAKDTNLEFSADQYDRLTEFSKHYSRVRYPDISQESYNTKVKVKPIIETGKELYRWIKKQLPDQ